MSKEEKIGLALLVVVALIACIFTWKSCSYNPDLKFQDTIDSLQAGKDLAISKADSARDTSQIFHQKYEVGNKKYNSPIDSSERENVWTKYRNAVAADTNGGNSLR